MLFDSQQKGGAEMCVGELFIRNATCEKVLGVKIYHHLNFDDNLNSLRKRVTEKLGALGKVKPYMFDKRKLNMSSFFNGNLIFTYKYACYTVVVVIIEKPTI